MRVVLKPVGAKSSPIVINREWWAPHYWLLDTLRLSSGIKTLQITRIRPVACPRSQRIAVP